MTEPAKQDARWRTKYGQWALVTGASEGIGRALAESAAAKGLPLVLVARRQALLHEVAQGLTARYAIQTRVIAADLSQPAGVATVIAGTDDLPLGLFIACAGFGTSGEFITLPLADELAMVDVNIRAVTALTHHFARRFAAQGHGGIILMSSLLAFQGTPRAANYAATKAYIQSLAEGLRRELAPRGVDIIAAAPGPIHSGFAARANMQMGLALQPAGVAHATLKALGKRTTVRPGWLSKLLEGSLAWLPRSQRVRIMAQVMKGMTHHQEQGQIRTSDGAA